MKDLPFIEIDDTKVSRESKKSPPARFQRIPLRDALTREASWIALGIVETGNLHDKLLCGSSIKDDDALAALGLRYDEGSGPITNAGLRSAIRNQYRRIKDHRLPANDRLQRNIDKLSEALRFNDIDRLVLRIAVAVNAAPGFGDFIEACDLQMPQLLRYLSRVLKISSVRLALAFSATGGLRRAGFFDREDCEFESNPLKLQKWVAQGLRSRDFEPTQLVRRIVKVSPAPKLVAEDFGHIADRDLVVRYITDALARKRKGANVLIHGQTGTGKTEFVRELAGSLGVRLYEVPSEDKDGDPISGPRRFQAFSTCQRLLSGAKDEILLFDEVEDVFGSGGFSDVFGFPLDRFRDGRELRKGWINEVLESNPVPSIWVCNSVAAMDPAYLRRYDIVVEFSPPNRAVRRRVVDRYFSKGQISSEFAARLTDDDRVSPAHVERAARVVRTLRSRDVAMREREIERLLAGSLRASGHTRPLASLPIPEYYDPKFLRTDTDLTAIADGLAHGTNARICMYGPPGTGKTAFAHHLGRRLDRPLLVRRGSDLISKYVGETEVRIARTFAKAQDDGAILVIDEADGFLRSRLIAERSWEVTQVNELLTQMESFEGIFVASTNLVDMLDAAALRRFDFKVCFDYLARDQRRDFLAKVCGGYAIDPAVQARLDRLDCIAPGDFTNVLRQLRVRGEEPAPAQIVELLKREASLKPDGNKRSIGFV